MNRSTKRKKYSLGSSFRKKSLTSFGDFCQKKTEEKDDDISGFSSSSSEDDFWDRSRHSKKDPHPANLLEVNDKEQNIKIGWSSGSEHQDEEQEEMEEMEVENFDETIVRQTRKSKKSWNTSIHEYNSDDDHITETDTQSQTQTMKNVDPPQENLSQLTEDSVKEFSPSPLPSHQTHMFITNKTDIFDDQGEEDENEDGPDSAKKAKKYVKGGLVEALSKLIAREKSDLAFWRHDIKSSERREETLSVEVLTIKASYSLCNIRCKIVSADMEFFVLLPAQNVKKLKLKDHSKFRIYPPWKRLYCKDLKSVVLLCVYHILVNVNTESFEMTIAEKDLQEFFEKHIHDTDQDGLPQLETTLHCKDEIEVSGKYLSIIEAIEEKNLTGRISFCARIQRVFCKYMKKEETGCRTFQLQIGSNNEFELRYSLLVQDHFGMISEIVLSKSLHTNNQVKYLIKDGEGMLCSFKNLKIDKRIPHRRHSAYQSMIQRFLPSKEELMEGSSQLEDSDSQSGIYNIPHSSYLFITDDVYTEINLQDTPEKFNFAYKPPSIITEKIQSINERMSVYCKLVTVTYSNEDMETYNSEVKFHVVNLCCGNEILSIRKLNTCYMPSAIADRIRATSKDIKLFVKDIRSQDGRYVADCYSRILELNDHNIKTQVELRLSAISENLLPVIMDISETSKEHDIVSVKGTIIDVNEDTAKMWMICCECTYDKNEKFEKRYSICLHCLKETQSKLMFHLDVSLKVSQLSDCRIQCELLTTTVAKMLPDPAQQDDFQGFDVDMILDKMIGPILCHVLQVERKQSNMILISLRQIKSFCEFVTLDQS